MKDRKTNRELNDYVKRDTHTESEKEMERSLRK